jgi:hypothetical protein
MQKEDPSSLQADTHQAKPQAKYCTTVYVLYRIPSSVLDVKKESNKVALATNI